MASPSPLFFRLVATFAALATGAPAVAQPSAPAPAAGLAPDRLQVAPPEVMDRTVRQLAGRTVYAPDGAKLGTIKDFVIEKRTGRVVYAVVSSGGLAGAGDTLRLIPIHALLSPPAGAPGFSVRVSQADFRRAPALIDEAFDRGLVVVTAEQRRAHDDLFGPPPVASAPPAGPALPLDRDAALIASPYVRATHLRGKPLHSAQQPVGTIDDLVVDLRRHVALALVDVDDTLLPGDRRALVPVTELALDRAPLGAAIATHRTREEFIQLDPAARHRADARLLPTGRPSPTRPEATLAAAVRSARQALDAHAELARAEIHVAAGEGILLLRGRVATAQLKRQAESAVHDAASGLRVQNELVIDPR